MVKTNEVFLILHDIRSTHNVGSIFRTAEAAGVAKIFLTGYTPEPIDTFGRPRKDFAKVALGAEKNILWEKVTALPPLFKKLKQEKFQIISIEQSPRSIDYKKIKMGEKVVFVLGNEVSGLPASVLEQSDTIAEIPMAGKKESLNVSVSCGIVLFRVLDS